MVHCRTHQYPEIQVVILEEVKLWAVSYLLPLAMPKLRVLQVGLLLRSMHDEFLCSHSKRYS